MVYHLVFDLLGSSQLFCFVESKSKAFAGKMKTSMKWKGGVQHPTEEITPTHAFCVPLETCVPSSNNEVRLHLQFHLVVKDLIPIYIRFYLCPSIRIFCACLILQANT